jgi:hypothetical protein
MRIWVDADACPREVKEIIFRAAERRGIATVLVANAPMFVPRSALVSAVRVPKGPDVADSYILVESEPGDVAVTADIPLAAELVDKGLAVIDPRGALYSEENVRERLSTRDFMQHLRDSGVETDGPKPFDERAKREFANRFDTVLSRALLR